MKRTLLENRLPVRVDVPAGIDETVDAGVLGEALGGGGVVEQHSDPYRVGGIVVRAGAQFGPARHLLDDRLPPQLALGELLVDPLQLRIEDCRQQLGYPEIEADEQRLVRSRSAPRGCSCRRRGTSPLEQRCVSRW